MIAIRLIAAGLAVALSLNAARAMDGDLTGSIARPATAETVQDIAALATDARPAAVTLPEQSVTTTNPAPKALPPLKPLPRWDPRVCVGC